MFVRVRFLCQHHLFIGGSLDAALVVDWAFFPKSLVL